MQSQAPLSAKRDFFLRGIRSRFPQCTVSMYSGKRALSPFNVAGMEELKREGHSLLFADRIPTGGKEGSTAKE